jgi:uncharacterized protein YgbK (DUF1537 family)
MSRLLLGCIADDFTGATDLANNLVRSGMRTVQVIGVPAADEVPHDVDAIVVALKSRTAPMVDAVLASTQAASWLKAQGAAQIYFKYCSTFDSTPFGNIGPVTDALMDALGTPFTVATPAFPLNGRTVFNGHLFVGSQLLSDSGMRLHPLTPMTDSNLVRVLQAQARHRVGLVAHDVVRRGVDAVLERFRSLQAEGVQIAVLDAIDDEDLLTLGRAMDGMALLTAASGLAIGLADNWRARNQLPPVGNRADGLPQASGLRAIVSGSCSAATNAQVQRFVKQGGAAMAIDPLALAHGEPVVERALDWTAERLAKGPVLVYATADSQSVQRVQEELGVGRAGMLVEAALSRIAKGVVEQGVGQLVVAGGETSGAVVQALGVQHMRIGAQIDPGVPWTWAQAQACGGKPLHLALKSGNFGTEDFFSKAFERLPA